MTILIQSDSQSVFDKFIFMVNVKVSKHFKQGLQDCCIYNYIYVYKYLFIYYIYNIIYIYIYIYIYYILVLVIGAQLYNAMNCCMLLDTCAIIS